MTFLTIHLYSIHIYEITYKYIYIYILTQCVMHNYVYSIASFTLCISGTHIQRPLTNMYIYAGNPSSFPKSPRSSSIKRTKILQNAICSMQLGCSVVVPYAAPIKRILYISFMFNICCML